MCGIAGIYNLDNSPIDNRQLVEMTNIVRHRGPDDEGYLLVNTQSGAINHYHGDDTIEPVKRRTQHINQAQPANLGFGYRRLSIIDLTSAGHQPMSSADGSLWIVYNGEIFNYLELREELTKLGYSFRSNSDTEVILAAYEEWGTECLNQFNGMWSFALWDNRKKRLFCARDRFGIKPFAYYFDDKRFIFGSEIKQILINPVDRTLNMPMIYRGMKLNSFLCYGDETYFENIKVLPHGHFIIIENGQMQRRKYYDLDPATFETSRISFAEASEQYRELFIDAVRLRMRSDVEVGSCLSGGLDSSAVVCTAVKNTTQRFKTFTAYYTDEERYDERYWAEIVGKHANCEMYYVSPDPAEILADFDRMTWFNDYPIVGSSFISQHYLMRLARQTGVPVLLDGQGSDEILAGYNHAFYRYYADLLSKLRWLKFAKEFPTYLKHNQKGTIGAKFAKTLLAWIFKESTLYDQEAKRLFESPFTEKIEDSQLFRQIVDLPVSRLSNFLYNLLMTTSIQTLLHFEDRNSMAHSIETRVPFLDYRLVEFVFRLPSEYKVSGYSGKLIHRHALREIVPAEILNRKDKVNFTAPGEKYWLRRDWQSGLSEVFQSAPLNHRPIYNQKKLTSIYNRFLAGDEKLSTLIWRIYGLEKWLRMND
ncbi:MAG: asparagine synthase (glutamine-hydrolyzing) [Candidatus Marinimicrobia bacterium]|nr:asparagine synthase (glutamine-hydrolyzing) [Candidatus Neomarinimicrobiota bacterium]